MSLIKCPKCQNVVSDRATKCPHCRTTLKIAVHSYCEECGAELAPDDKTCQVCGFPVYNNIVPRKSSGGWKTVLLSCILSVILSLLTSIFAIFLFINGVVKNNGGESFLKSIGIDSSIITWDLNSEKKSKDKDDAKPKAPEKTEFFMGEIAEYNGVQLSISDFYISGGNEWASPPDGYVFLYLNMSATNNSEKEILISSLSSFEAYCDDHKIDNGLDASIAGSADGKQELDGHIAPGKKMDGYIGLVVPSNWGKIELYYKDNVWLESNFKFTINHKQE